MIALSNLSNARVVDAACRQDFPSFVRKCFRTLAPATPFCSNWHIDAMAYYLEQVRIGKTRRLIINTPPRSLKSIVCSVAFPAFVLGHQPTRRIIAVSYGADLAIKHANDFRVVVTSGWFPRVFPATRLSRTKNTEFEVVTTQNGYRLATSVDGTLTGRGGDLVIVDDPLKPIDALSESSRERVNQWFSNTLLSRLDDKRTGAIVIVAQRLHPADLPGMLLRTSDDWTVLRLPAIAEDEEIVQVGDTQVHHRHVGDLLHPEREPLTVLNAMRAQLGSYTFSAQYQQSPIPLEGAMIKRQWPRRYDRLPSRAASEVIQSYDTAAKDGVANDFSVCTTWLVHNGNYYLIDVMRGRFNYPTLKARAMSLAREARPNRILIEDTGIGTALIAELRNVGLPAIAVKPERDKITRMAVQSAKFESAARKTPCALRAWRNRSHKRKAPGHRPGLFVCRSGADQYFVASGAPQTKR